MEYYLTDQQFVIIKKLIKEIELIKEQEILEQKKKNAENVMLLIVGILHLLLLIASLFVPFSTQLIY